MSSSEKGATNEPKESHKEQVGKENTKDSAKMSQQTAKATPATQELTEVIPAERGIAPPKAYHIMGIPFYSRKVFYEFLITSFLVIVVPVIMVMKLGPYVDTLPLSDTMKTVYKAGPAVFFINLVMAVYIYRAIRDPANYEILKNEPIRIKKDK